MTYINEKTKRINVDKIPELFSKLGMKPVCNTFGSPAAKSPCGCLLTALLCEKIGVEETDSMLVQYTLQAVPRAARILDLSTDYTQGLVAGFDGKFTPKGVDHYNGFVDGAAAIRLLVNRGVK
jgi:hypothetical protein